MKIKSPFLTLIVGVLIAVVIAVLSVRAHARESGPYGAAAPAVVWE